MFGIFAFAASTAVPAGVTTYALTKITLPRYTKRGNPRRTTNDVDEPILITTTLCYTA